MKVHLAPDGPLGAGEASVRCGCCQKTRTGPEDLATFGKLTDAGGKVWDICGKCIRAMWKRAPKLEPLDMA